MDRRSFLVRSGVVAAAGLAGCTALATDEGDHDVGMTAMAFDPPEITVRVGQDVVWKNTSSRAHTVTAYEDAIPDEAEFFASGGYETEDAARDAFFGKFGGAIQSGETYTHAFGVPGRYDYLCIPHEQAGMIGAVIVEE